MWKAHAMAEYNLSGKVALVTGGARGIGFATAKALSSRGADVVVLDVEEDTSRQAATQIDDRALGIGADVTDRGAMQRAVATTVERFGGLDVVMANAGIAPRGATLRAMAGESVDRVLDVNVGGVVNTVEAALPEIVRRRGHAVVVASIYAFWNGIGVVPYAMSKAAVEQLGRALRVELVQHGASASVAYFGFIDTEMVHQGIDQDPLADEMFEALPNVLQKRLTPAQAGEAVVRGIEQRRPRIIVPRRWIALSVLRGITGPLLDKRMERDAAVQAVLTKLDGREGEAQPTTAHAHVGDAQAG
jgi:NAD(P)-dependent dehydrogenase (short-subunit alcohol dehydrogenase family)